ncbi:hypothetical protein CEUSTIGMA_g2657.t1 [Chlamydomonas eustigma]|uniref:Zinc-finger domain-containing protein n=1 Tax=Chlamydomonas eustigma TaxID=1157962 RepID=A0A250WWI1_9CHLO|nr:hypothetical protein CEUSTIGMA_g2657.t1 [Chlamydomonas eustigma]|eukprot:GAX75213.1 hypothetical protein CEUSTIGMA_g2657.t1 [Chlamydomonas eustigma]
MPCNMLTCMYYEQLRGIVHVIVYRQKKLCGEPDCLRCQSRNVDLECIGKSDCSRCHSANGRFCRACLLIKYGEKLDDVRRKMKAGKWLCPHCYKEEHADELPGRRQCLLKVMSGTVLHLSRL